MGQYYRAINFDKKEYLSPYDFNDGAKLMEFSYQGNKFVNALEKLLTTSWICNRVAIIGDYISEDIFMKDLIENEDIKHTLESLAEEFHTDYLYNIDGFKKINVQDIENGNVPSPYRFIANHKTQEYVDLKKSPIQWVYNDDDGISFAKINPLPLLLCANNHSGGSYHSSACQNLVGAWVKDMGFIEPCNCVCGTYSEVLALFDEVGNSCNIQSFLIDYEGNRRSNYSIILDACKVFSNSSKKIFNKEWLFLSDEERETIDKITSTMSVEVSSELYCEIQEYAKTHGLEVQEAIEFIMHQNFVHNY